MIHLFDVIAPRRKKKQFSFLASQYPKGKFTECFMFDKVKYCSAIFVEDGSDDAKSAKLT